MASGIHVRLIAVALRTHSPETAAEVARAAVEALPDGLTGFDLAGLEHLAPDPRRFAAAFEIARQGGLGITCHAGEWGGAAQVRAALAIDPWRIAHGAPAADDATLMADLRARDVTLDLCPTSNLPGRHRQRRWQRRPSPASCGPACPSPSAPTTGRSAT